MNISTRLGASAASAAATLALAVGAFGFAAPASAESIVAPSTSPTSAPAPSTSATPTASPSPTPTPTTTTPTPKPPKKKGKAKISHYKKLTKKAKRVAIKVRNDWAKIKKIGGWRAGSRYSGDHPAGRAIDVMIPSWRKNVGVGKSIASYFARHAKKYKIHYVIYRQKIWTVQNPRWRAMGNRGGATANHFDHVHISVKR